MLVLKNSSKSKSLDMKTLYFSLILYFLHLNSIQSQSFEEESPYKAVKLGINYGLSFSNSNLDFQDQFANKLPIGSIVPVFVWSNKKNSWWEVSLPILTLNSEVNRTILGTTKSENTEGKLTTQYQIGLSIEKGIGIGRIMSKIPLYCTFGLTPMIGKYNFKSNNASDLELVSNDYGLNLFIAPKLMLVNKKHFFVDAQLYFVGNVNYSSKNYTKVKGIAPENLNSNLTNFAPLNSMLPRIGIGYRL
jgi:hypothetical protein